MKWLSFSTRSPPHLEMVKVLAINLDSEAGPLVDPDRQLLDPWDILSICCSLVIISGPDPKQDRGEVTRVDGKNTNQVSPPIT